MPRRTLPFALLAAGSLILALGGPASAQPAADRVDVVQIDGVLDQHVAGYLRDVMARAGEEGSALVAIQLDTGGGLNVDPEELVAPIRDSDVPVLTFVGDSGARALGAGVFVAQASDHLMLSPVTQMGAAAPADLRDGPPDAAARSEAAALCATSPPSRTATPTSPPPPPTARSPCSWPPARPRPTSTRPRWRGPPPAT